MESEAVTNKFELSLAQKEVSSLRRQLEQVHAEMRDKSSAWREEKALAAREKLDLERQVVTASDELASAQAAASFANRALEDRDKLVKRLQAQVDSLQVGQRAIGDSAKNSQFAQLAELYKSKFEQCDAQRERLRAELQKKSDDLQIKTAEAREATMKLEQEQAHVRQLQIDVANLASGIPDNLILSKDKLLNVIHQFMDEERSKRRNTQKRPTTDVIDLDSQSDNDEVRAVDVHSGDADLVTMDTGAETEDQVITETSPAASPAKRSLADLEIARLLQSAAESENLHMLISMQQQYELATAQLVKQRSENRQLEEYFVRIEDEMKRTEPLMAEKNRKYENALAELSTVKSQLTDATTKLQQREHEVAQHQRKIASLQQQVKQTSNQIQTLLHQGQSGHSAANSSLADIASLHSRNVDLEILTRDLQSHVEALETELESKNFELQAMSERYEQVESIVASLEATIGAQEAVQKMSNARNKRRSSINASSQNDIDLDASGTLADSSLIVNTSQEDGNQGGSMLLDDSGTEQNFSRALTPFNIDESPKYQHALLRIEEIQRFAEELTHERDAWRDTTQKLQNTLSSKEAELERFASRSNTLQATHAMHEEQITDLRTKSQRLAELVARYETQVSDLNTARSSAVGDASTSAQLLEVAKMQVQLYKDQLDDLKLSLAQAREQSQTAQAHFRESASLHHKQEQHWIDVGAQQEARIVAIQRALEEGERDADAKISNLQEMLAALRTEHASAQDKVSHLEEIVALKDQSLAQLKEVLEENKSTISTLKKRFPSAAAIEPSPSPEPVLQDNTELNELKMSLEEKTEELRIANEHLKSKSDLLASLESKLTQIQSSYTILTEESQASLQEFESEIGTLQDQLKQRSDSESALLQKYEELVAQHNDVSSHYESLKIAHDAIAEECENVRRERESLKVDAQTLETTLKSTRANYQHQMTELSNTLSQLDSLQKKNEKVTQERDSLLNKLQASQQNLQTQKAQFDLKTTAHRSEIESLQQRIQDGVSNLASLNAELGMAKSQLNYWKTLSGGQASSTTPNDNDINLAIHAQSNDSFEVPANETNTLGWLQREWQIALSNLSIAQSELEELRAQVQLSRETNERLSNENRNLREGNAGENSKDFSNGSPAPSGLTLQQQKAHEKLQAQAEQLNLLRESNLMLRQQRESADKDSHELRAALGNLQIERDALQIQVTRLNSEKNTAASNAQMLSQQNEQWKGRVQELLTKYKDIETHAAQDAQIQELTEQMERLTNDNSEFQAQIEQLHLEQQNGFAISNKLVEEKTQLQRLLEEATNEVHSKTALYEENEALRAELEAEVERLKAESEEYKEQLQEYVDEIAALEDKEKTALKAADDAKKALAKSAAVSSPALPAAPAAKQTATTPAVAASPAAKQTAAPTAATPKAPVVTAPVLAKTVAVAAAPPPPAAPKKAPIAPSTAPVSTPAAVSTPSTAASVASSTVSNATTTTSALPAMESHLGDLKSRLTLLETAKAAKEAASAAHVAHVASDSAMQVDVPTAKATTAAVAAPAKTPSSVAPVAPPKAAPAPPKAAPAPPKAPAKAPTSTPVAVPPTAAVVPVVDAAPVATLPVASTTAAATAAPTVVSAAPTVVSAAPASDTNAVPAKRLPPPPPPAAKNAKRSFAQMSADAPAYVPAVASPSSPAPPSTASTTTTSDKTVSTPQEAVIPAVPSSSTATPAAAAVAPSTASTASGTTTASVLPPPPAKRLPPPPKKTASPAPSASSFPTAIPAAVAALVASSNTPQHSSPSTPNAAVEHQLVASTPTPVPTPTPSAILNDPHSEDAPASKRPRFAEADTAAQSSVHEMEQDFSVSTPSAAQASLDEPSTTDNVDTAHVATNSDATALASSAMDHGDEISSGMNVETSEAPTEPQLPSSTSSGMDVDASHDEGSEIHAGDIWHAADADDDGEEGDWDVFIRGQEDGGADDDAAEDEESHEQQEDSHAEELHEDDQHEDDLEEVGEDDQQQQQQQHATDDEDFEDGDEHALPHDSDEHAEEHAEEGLEGSTEEQHEAEEADADVYFPDDDQVPPFEEEAPEAEEEASEGQNQAPSSSDAGEWST